MPLPIRPATAADLERILAIAADSPNAPRWKAGDYAAFLTGPAEPPLLRSGFVAVAGDVAQGFAMASLLLDGVENRGDLDTLAVAPTARRHGLGSSLVRAVLTWAEAQGARRVTLEVRASNAPALLLYQHLGFAGEGCRPRYYADPEEDALLLGREVTEVPSTDPFSTTGAIEGGPPRC